MLTLEPARLRAFFAGAILGAILALALGWVLYRPGPAPIEKPASAVRQGDGSLLVARGAAGDVPKSAPHEIPRGGVEERRIHLEVRPRWTTPPERAPDSSAPPMTEGWTSSSSCPPVTVDLSLVRMPDGTRRVVASSPDGDVVGGLDVPLERRPAEPRPLRWAAGASYGMVDHSPGAWVTYSRGPFTAGADVFRTPARPPVPASFEARVMAGLRW